MPLTSFYKRRAKSNNYVPDPTSPLQLQAQSVPSAACPHQGNYVDVLDSSKCHICTERPVASDGKLKHCLYYHGNITANDATERLQTTPEGTYLLRDSSHPAYAYCLSIRTMTGVTSVRISFKNGQYRLDTSLPADEGDVELPCVLQLIEHYQNLSKAKTKTGKSKYVVVDILKGKFATPVGLVYPLFR